MAKKEKFVRLGEVKAIEVLVGGNRENGPITKTVKADKVKHTYDYTEFYDGEQVVARFSGYISWIVNEALIVS